jgi:inner membrane protein
MNIETTAQKIWSGSKLMVKTIIIGIIILILQIPKAYVEDLIHERESRQTEAVNEVSSKWAAKQNLTGPVLVVPFYEYTDSNQRIRTRHYAYFLPDQLNITSTLNPIEKYRGIYKVMLYSSMIQLSGSFDNPDFQKFTVSPNNIAWNEAFVRINLSDLKGLNEELKLKWNDSVLSFSPQASESKNSSDALVASLNITKPEDLRTVHFSGQINLNGSEELLFTPVGKSTNVSLTSRWPHPSFTGNSLPQTSEIANNGFQATWKSLAHKRNYPQQWFDDAYYINTNNSAGNTVVQDNASNNIVTSSFGTDLFVPVNAYQKTTRSVKYAMLCILLTFASFFLVETANRKSIHPFQYGLIGIALILFYTLLLSFSEYVGFNYSYLIASVATIALIGWFVKSILSSSRLTTLLVVILTLIYSYIFTILQLQDYSLLLGSIGLFITLAVIMHFSKKIQWSPAAII